MQEVEVVRLLVVLAALLHINAYAFDQLYYVPFPSCLILRGFVKEVEGPTVTIVINKGARSEAEIKLTFKDWEHVTLLPTTPIEVKEVEALTKEKFLVLKKNVKVVSKFNPWRNAIEREKICSHKSPELYY